MLGKDDLWSTASTQAPAQTERLKAEENTSHISEDTDFITQPQFTQGRHSHSQLGHTQRMSNCKKQLSSRNASLVLLFL